MQGGSFLFPITPVFNSSLQCSHNQSISLIAQPQDQGTIILSLSLSLKLPYTIVPPIPHINTPSKHLNSNESPTKIVDDIQAPNFSDQSQISTMVSDHTDHRPRAGLTCRYLMYRYVCMYASIHQQTLPSTRVRGSTHRDLCKSSNLTRTNKDRSRAGESLKLRCLPKDTC